MAKRLGESRVTHPRIARAAWLVLSAAIGLAGCDGCKQPGALCNRSEDCISNELCVSNKCRKACNTLLDCLVSERCANGACLPAADAGGTDARTGDGAAVDGVVVDSAGRDRVPTDRAATDQVVADLMGRDQAVDAAGRDRAADAGGGVDAGLCTGIVCLRGMACTVLGPASYECRCAGNVCDVGEECLLDEQPLPGQETARSCCPAGQHNCTGVCLGVESDVTHCGSCERACALGETCISGRCTCDSARGTTCDPATQDCCTGSCRSVLDDPDHCGRVGTGAGCGNACPTGSACILGRCACDPSGTCGGGATCCDGTYCADTTSDPGNCNGCGNQCRPGEVCTQSACACGPTCDDGIACTEDTCDLGRCIHSTLDGDNDGYCNGGCPDAETGAVGECIDGDCDDSAAAVHPGAAEVCNGVDDDCSGATADGASDCPGRCCGSPTPSCKQCCNPTQCGSGLGEWTCDGQCHCGGGGAGIDCDGTCYTGGRCCQSGDCGPGSWQCASSSHLCQCPSPGLACGNECRDANACGGCAVLEAPPGSSCGGCGNYVCDGTERVVCNGTGVNTCGGCSSLAHEPGVSCLTCGVYVCNGVNDIRCDGDHALIAYYLDGDGDGYGVGTPQSLCAASGNQRALQAGDCNDDAIDVHPGASDLCNGIDDDCNSTTGDGTACSGGASYCCGGSCRAYPGCCSSGQCGNGAWSCSGYSCVCPLGTCVDGYCRGASTCCVAADCGTGAWTCNASTHQCSCPVEVCSGNFCRTFSQCCDAADCGSAGWTCSALHACSCVDGAVCNSGDPYHCCSNQCFNWHTDPCHCHSCSACPGAEYCNNGTCATSCFVAGTLVALADGAERPIEQIQAGDRVIGYDLETEQLVAATVVRTIAHSEPQPLLQINGYLRATAEHPFFSDGEWVEAADLVPGNGLLRLPSTRDRLADDQVTSVEALTERAAVYNLEVNGPHNYFAGGLLVHNKPPICAD